MWCYFIMDLIRAFSWHFVKYFLDISSSIFQLIFCFFSVTPITCMLDHTEHWSSYLFLLLFFIPLFYLLHFGYILFLAFQFHYSFLLHCLIFKFLSALYHLFLFPFCLPFKYLNIFNNWFKSLSADCIISVISEFAFIDWFFLFSFLVIDHRSWFWFTFSCFFACLIIFDWMLDVVILCWWMSGFCCHLRILKVVLASG